MMDDELLARLSEYEDWKREPPGGWLPMPDLDLRGPIEFLFADGKRSKRPGASNTEWLVDSLRPVAWRPLEKGEPGPNLHKLRGYAR